MASFFKFPLPPQDILRLTPLGKSCLGNKKRALPQLHAALNLKKISISPAVSTM